MICHLLLILDQRCLRAMQRFSAPCVCMQNAWVLKDMGASEQRRMRSSCLQRVCFCARSSACASKSKRQNPFRSMQFGTRWVFDSVLVTSKEQTIVRKAMSDTSTTASSTENHILRHPNSSPSSPRLSHYHTSSGSTRMPKGRSSHPRLRERRQINGCRTHGWSILGSLLLPRYQHARLEDGQLGKPCRTFWLGSSHRGWGCFVGLQCICSGTGLRMLRRVSAGTSDV